jgi:hypothetical protein
MIYQIISPIESLERFKIIFEKYFKFYNKYIKLFLQHIHFFSDQKVKLMKFFQFANWRAGVLAFIIFFVVIINVNLVEARCVLNSGGGCNDMEMYQQCVTAQNQIDSHIHRLATLVKLDLSSNYQQTISTTPLLLQASAAYKFEQLAPKLFCSSNISCQASTTAQQDYDTIAYCENLDSYEKCVSAPTLLSEFISSVTCSYPLINLWCNATDVTIDTSSVGSVANKLNNLLASPHFDCDLVSDDQTFFNSGQQSVSFVIIYFVLLCFLIFFQLS